MAPKSKARWAPQVRRVCAGAGPQREYSWRPQLLEARRVGRRRPGVYGLELGRRVRRVQGRGHIVAASSLQLVKRTVLLSLQATHFFVGIKGSVTHFFSELGVTLPISRMSQKKPCVYLFSVMLRPRGHTGLEAKILYSDNFTTTFSEITERSLQWYNNEMDTTNIILHWIAHFSRPS